jgi:hypothetical protein
MGGGFGSHPPPIPLADRHPVQCTNWLFSQLLLPLLLLPQLRCCCCCCCCCRRWRRLRHPHPPCLRLQGSMKCGRWALGYGSASPRCCTAPTCPAATPSSPPRWAPHGGLLRALPQGPRGICNGCCRAMAFPANQLLVASTICSTISLGCLSSPCTTYPIAERFDQKQVLGLEQIHRLLVPFPPVVSRPLNLSAMPLLTAVVRYWEGVALLSNVAGKRAHVVRK